MTRGLLLGLALAVCLMGCKGKKTPAPTETATATQVLAQVSATAIPEIPETPLFPALTPTPYPGPVEATASPGPAYPGPVEATAYPAPVEPTVTPLEPTVTLIPANPTPSPSLLAPTATPIPFSPTPTSVLVEETAYPDPGNPDLGEATAYPGPVDATDYPGLIDATAYPGPVDATADPGPVDATAYPGPDTQPTPSSTVTPRASATATQFGPTGTRPATTPSGSITPVLTERYSQPLGMPPAAAGTVTIWHAWNSEQAEALMEVVAAFQKSFPDVRFDVAVLPKTELRSRYESEAYQGRGPSLLIGSSDWTAYLVDRQLVEDLTPYISPAFRQTIYPAALETGSYQKRLACLPLSISGVLLYRNTQMLPEPAQTMDELLAQAEAATRGGKVGAYLDRGFAFSFAHLYGMGGQLMDETGAPAFQDQDYRYSLAWIDLLKSFAQPGATSQNDEKDTSIFNQGRAGYLIEGSWSLPALANAIGAENLAVDPWPTLPQGQMSGYVKAESLYLNINTAALSPEDHLATLRFMGYLMTTPVQEYLAAQGFIPSLKQASPRDPLLAQAHAAFAGGTAYPAVLLSKESALRPIYQDHLDAALVDIFEHGIAPRTALEKALLNIQTRLQALK